MGYDSHENCILFWNSPSLWKLVAVFPFVSSYLMHGLFACLLHKENRYLFSGVDGGNFHMGDNFCHFLFAPVNWVHKMVYSSEQILFLKNRCPMAMEKNISDWVASPCIFSPWTALPCGTILVFSGVLAFLTISFSNFLSFSPTSVTDLLDRKQQFFILQNPFS